jgi:GT2 family glycosyltransferase
VNLPDKGSGPAGGGESRQGTGAGGSQPGKVSVIVVTFNGRKFLENCLTALSEQSYRDFEIILVDNASSDDSANFVAARFPGVRIVRNAVNLGFAGGVNSGIRATKGEYILLLNNDTVPDRDFIGELVRPVLGENDTGMCAAKMLFPDGRINSAGICISLSGASWDRGRGRPDVGQYDREEEVFGPCGGAAIYRRRMLDQIGLLDEDLFLFMEDVDLAFRARLAGWRCVFVPGARVVHHHGGTAGVMSDLAVYYVNRNVIWYPVKDFPATLLIPALFWIAGRTISVIPYYFALGKGRTIIRSKIDGIRGIPKMLRKRGAVIRSAGTRDISRWVRIWCAVRRGG